MPELLHYVMENVQIQIQNYLKTGRSYVALIIFKKWCHSSIVYPYEYL